MPSSVIERFAYNVSTGNLIIYFRSGAVYEYKKVPEEIFNSFKTAFSKGTFFNRQIKNFYKFSKLKSVNGD